MPVSDVCVTLSLSYGDTTRPGVSVTPESRWLEVHRRRNPSYNIIAGFSCSEVLFMLLMSESYFDN